MCIPAFLDAPREQEILAVKKVARKRCEKRAFETIYRLGKLDDPRLIKTFLTTLSGFQKKLQTVKHGIYQSFGVVHVEENKEMHLHVGCILRQQKIKDLYWDELKKYFTVGEYVPYEHSDIKAGGTLVKKLNTYYAYCMGLTEDSAKKHEGQEIHLAWSTFEYKPAAKKERPSDILIQKIRDGMTIDEFEDYLEEETTSLKVYKEGMANYEKYCKIIRTRDEIRSKKESRKRYKEKFETLRPFQKGLSAILDKQNDRNIHNHSDLGCTGKNYWLDVERLRPDTLVLQSAETKRIAYAWNPEKHKRIIFDIPKHEMCKVNLTVLENLKNGVLFSTMHHPKTKCSTFKPSIIVLGNEWLENTWTEDRMTRSTTNKSDFELRMVEENEIGDFL